MFGYGGLYDPVIPLPEPVVVNEWSHLFVSSDGTKLGTKVFWHGDEITSLVKIDFIEDPPETEPSSALEAAFCPVCHGDGWGKSEQGKGIPCRNCYGRGKTNWRPKPRHMNQTRTP